MTTLRLDSRNVFGSDGSGNQKKLWVGDTLIKLNSKYREASKEVSACILGKAFGLNIVEYRKDEYIYKNQKHIGCECKSFLRPGDISIPAVDILNFYNITITRNMSAVDYFNITVKCISDYTGISIHDVAMYIMQMLVFDFIICNNDRHLTNFEFIYNEVNKTWRFTPIYDHGQSFLCRDGGLSLAQIESEIHKIKMKPFSSNPYKNLIDIKMAQNIARQFVSNVNSVYGSFDNIPINEFHRKIAKIQIKNLLNKA